MTNLITEIAKQGMFEERRAIFSPCRSYRYLLESVWDALLGVVTFILLNPSTATHVASDPTNVRGERFTRAWGYGAMRYVNLFAFRTVKPAAMMSVADPIGPDNDTAILEACRDAALIVCAWGNHGTYLDRATEVKTMLIAEGHTLHILRLTKTGQPQHPLYLPARLQPAQWVEAASMLVGP